MNWKSDKFRTLNMDMNGKKWKHFDKQNMATGQYTEHAVL